MFIVSVTYKKSLVEIEKQIISHREFLDRYYQAGIFVMSGPKVPRTGGIIFANAKNKETLEALIKEDPFYQHDLADYEIIEFTPTKYQPENFNSHQ